MTPTCDAEGRERPAGSHRRGTSQRSAAEVEVQLERDARATHRPIADTGLADGAKGRRAVKTQNWAEVMSLRGYSPLGAPPRMPRNRARPAMPRMLTTVPT